MWSSPAALWLSRAGVKTIPDATFALAIATAVDQALELAISTHFDAEEDVIALMFDGNANGPLSEFSARIKTGRALGIYPSAIKEELDLIRHIRNAFAIRGRILILAMTRLWQLAHNCAFLTTLNTAPLGQNLLGRQSPATCFPLGTYMCTWSGAARVGQSGSQIILTRRCSKRFRPRSRKNRRINLRNEVTDCHARGLARARGFPGHSRSLPADGPMGNNWRSHSGTIRQFLAKFSRRV